MIPKSNPPQKSFGLLLHFRSLAGYVLSLTETPTEQAWGAKRDD